MGLLVGLQNREQLPVIVADELDQITAALQAFPFIDPRTQPRCIAYNNTTQSVADSTVTTLTLNSEDVDIGSMHDNTANTSRITIPSDGFYLVTGNVTFAANATGTRQALLNKNTTTAQFAVRTSVGAGVVEVFPVVVMLQLVAGDYLELQVFQNSGGALNLGHASTRSLQTSLSVVKLW